MVKNVMNEWIPSLVSEWQASDIIFLVLLAISILVMLYAITLIHNKLRLIEHELQEIRKDQMVISDELEEVIASPTRENSKSLNESK